MSDAETASRPARPVPWGRLPDPPLIVAHRGAAALWVENSLDAFARSLAAGWRAVEFDVHFTRDGVPVVIHDLTLDRTTDGSGPVADMDLAQLRRLRLKGTAGAMVPTLHEVLDLLRAEGGLAIVEVKFAAGTPLHARNCAALTDVLQQARMRERVTITAFDWRSIAEIAGSGAGFDLTGVLRAADVPDAAAATAWARRLKEMGGRQLLVQHTAIDAAVVAACAAEGIGLGAWTPNEAEDLARLGAIGVDWIITDRPDRAPGWRAHPTGANS
ncbi:MAG: glycerophosphodiester phosphodiesterase [Alphaproteobacteria bacterium]